MTDHLQITEQENQELARTLEEKKPTPCGWGRVGRERKIQEKI